MEIVFTRNSEKLSRELAEKMSFTAFSCNVRYFNNREMSVSLRKPFREVIVVASTATNDDWMELFLLLGCLRDANKVILCLTYMGYSRQSQQIPNESFAARSLCVMLETFNISNCIIIDNHSEPMFRIPTKHISAQSLFQKEISAKYKPNQIAIVSPDIGGASRAYEIARSIGAECIICNKERSVFGELKKVDPIGKVAGKICVLVDDMVDSGSTLRKASDALVEAGSHDVVAYCTHSILSEGAVERLEESHITEFVFADTIHNEYLLSPKFRKLSIVSLIVDAIRCIL